MFFLCVCCFVVDPTKPDMYSIPSLFLQKALYLTEDVEHLQRWQSSYSSLAGSSICVESTATFIFPSLKYSAFLYLFNFLFLCRPLAVALALKPFLFTMYNLKDSQRRATVLLNICTSTVSTVPFNFHLPPMHFKALRALNVCIRPGLVLCLILKFICTIGLGLIIRLHISVTQTSSVFNSVITVQSGHSVAPLTRPS